MVVSFQYISTFIGKVEPEIELVMLHTQPSLHVRRFFIQRCLVYFTSLPESKTNPNCLHQAPFLQTSPEEGWLSSVLTFWWNIEVDIIEILHYIHIEILEKYWYNKLILKGCISTETRASPCILSNHVQGINIQLSLHSIVHSWHARHLWVRTPSESLFPNILSNTHLKQAQIY